RRCHRQPTTAAACGRHGGEYGIAAVVAIGRGCSACSNTTTTATATVEFHERGKTRPRRHGPSTCDGQHQWAVNVQIPIRFPGNGRRDIERSGRGRRGEIGR